MNTVEIIGRSSSLYTRMALIFAHELGVAVQLAPVADMTALGRQAYADNPALKLPILRTPGGVLFGAQNICRAIAERAARPARIVWPEELRDDLSRNAQELVGHCMGAQVQLIIGTLVSKLPADNIFFVKARAGLEGSLHWLDAHLDGALHVLPTPRDLSMFEVSLFCLIEHLAFRGTVAVEPYPSLGRFAAQFADRPSARHTSYQYD
ncbi:MAG: glutathione S-transferase N-terminal domain-containing protein [Steroidobacteraceae bacterium]